MKSQLCLSFGALFAACSCVQAASPPMPARYSYCASNHLPEASLPALRKAVVKAIWPKIAAAEVGSAVAENRVIIAPADLRPGHRSFIVYVSGRSTCGSAGCNAYVFDQREGDDIPSSGYVLMGEIVPARLPISTLQTSHNGWHDIAVKVAGGGIIPGYTGALTFDGKSYDSNPTLSGISHVPDGSGEIILGAPGASPSQCRLR